MGNLLLTVRRRTPPIIYNVKDRKVNYKFYHPSCNNWSKKCTPCFAGEYDEYFLIGSDVGKSIFMWDIPDVFIRKLLLRFNYNMAPNSPQIHGKASQRRKAQEPHVLQCICEL